MVPRVGARGQSSLSSDTGGLSYQVSSPSVGQFPCPSTAAFMPTTFVPLSNPVEPSLGPPMSSRSAALATLSSQVESFSRLTQRMQALAQALQSQLSAVATPSPALPFPTPVVPPSFPVPLASPTPSKPRQKAKRARRQPPDFTPFGQSLSSLFPGVAHLLTLPEVCPPLDPLPAWFRPLLFCMFHRCASHSTDKCFTLQNVVRDLINAGTIMIPIAAQSPLPASTVQLGQGWQSRPRRQPHQYTPLAEPLSAIFPLVQPLLRELALHPFSQFDL